MGTKWFGAPPANVNTLKNGQFMSAIDAWKAIQSKDYVFEDAPAGNKFNVWFLINNTDNIKRRGKYISHFVELSSRTGHLCGELL
jgi:hypothetical protein